MSFEDRLERLRQRHEALTQTIQLMGAGRRQTVTENKQHDRRLAQIMESIARLVHVAEIHARRITGLEDAR
jgi:hypothetical protein